MGCQSTGCFEELYPNGTSSSTPIPSFGDLNLGKEPFRQLVADPEAEKFMERGNAIAEAKRGHQEHEEAEAMRQRKSKEERG